MSDQQSLLTKQLSDEKSDAPVFDIPSQNDYIGKINALDVSDKTKRSQIKMFKSLIASEDFVDIVKGSDTISFYFMNPIPGAMPVFQLVLREKYNPANIQSKLVKKSRRLFDTMDEPIVETKYHCIYHEDCGVPDVMTAAFGLVRGLGFDAMFLKYLEDYDYADLKVYSKIVVSSESDFGPMREYSKKIPISELQYFCD